MIYKPQFIILAILQVLDIISTIYFLEYTFLVEGNPLALILLSNFGYIGLIIPKIMILGLFYYLFTKHKEECKHWFIKYGTWFMITFYVFVVTWNVIGIIT